MKVARFVLKLVALGLAVGAAVCAIIAYWDKIADLFCTVNDKLAEKKAACCPTPMEFEDYADCDL